MDASTVVVGGAGGNIGSHLVPHLGRMAGVERVVLVDPDAYEEKNLSSQDILPEDVGVPKVEAQARRLRSLRPTLEVAALRDRVQHVPLGRLRGEVMLGCFDNNAARQFLSEVAWRLGAVYIDAGVRPDSMLARVNVYVPGDDAPCLQCAWDERHYARLAQPAPCDEDRDDAEATDGPSSLGALAASLLAIECAKLLQGRRELLVAGKQVLLDAAHHRHFLSQLTRNPHCRFDHRTWAIQRIVLGDGEGRLRDIPGLTGGTGPGALSLRLASRGGLFRGRSFDCPRCARSTRAFGPLPELPARIRCPGCSTEIGDGRLEVLEALDPSTLTPCTLERPLASLGIRPGDVLSLHGPGTERYLEMTWPDSSSREQWETPRLEAVQDGPDARRAIPEK